MLDDPRGALAMPPAIRDEPAPAMGPVHLSVEGVAKRFRQTEVLTGVDLGVGEGELVSLLGPSGCGKTTLLRAIAGLVPVDAGRIRVAGRDLTDIPPHRRKVGVVFQNYALFPHLTVAGNIGIGLRAQGLSRMATRERVAEMLALVRLEPLAERSVGALSGGQQQRVAVARALAVSPSLLLLDEPFSALDRKLRETMQVELRQLLKARGITAVFVTHDQEEAMLLSDRIAVMNHGRIEQFAEPVRLYREPASRFVFAFVGQSTMLSGTVVEARDGLVGVQTALGLVRAPGHFIRGAAVTVCLRPETLRLETGKARAVDGQRDDGRGSNLLRCPIKQASFFGSRALVYGDVAEPDRFLLELDARELAAIDVEAGIEVGWDVAATLIFPASDE